MPNSPSMMRCSSESLILADGNLVMLQVSHTRLFTVSHQYLLNDYQVQAPHG